jgi:hypothetical protein
MEVKESTRMTLRGFVLMGMQERRLDKGEQ